MSKVAYRDGGGDVAGEADEAEALGAASGLVTDNAHALDGAIGLEGTAEVVLWGKAT